MDWRRFFRRSPKVVPLLSKEGGTPVFKTYDELMDELTYWNVQNTDILRLLRKEIADERLMAWSEALTKGVRTVMREGPSEGNTSSYEACLDLYDFVLRQRACLASEPSLRGAKGTRDLDPITVCIVCGIRALQRELGMPARMSTLVLKLLQRYLEEPSPP